MAPPRNGAAKRYGSVCWAPDASLVACGAADGSVTVWDVTKGVIRTTLRGSDQVKTVRFAADGASLLGLNDNPRRRAAANGEAPRVEWRGERNRRRRARRFNSSAPPVERRRLRRRVEPRAPRQGDGAADAARRARDVRPMPRVDKGREARRFFGRCARDPGPRLRL